eukprot:GSChrysophyteH1.ASY1.ANO1.1285.1 assembled CDS
MITANAPLFIQKAQFLHGCNFIIGTNTFQRLLNSAYYADHQEAAVAATAASGGEPDVVAQVLGMIQSFGTNFIVGTGSNVPGNGFKTFDTAHAAGEELVYNRRPYFPTETRAMFQYIEAIENDSENDEQ